jgi:hypothetical protein
MNDAATLPRHVSDIRALTAEAFAPCVRSSSSLRTGGQSAETSYDPDGRRIRVLWEDSLEMGVCTPVISTRPAMTLLE